MTDDIYLNYDDEDFQDDINEPEFDGDDNSGSTFGTVSSPDEMTNDPGISEIPAYGMLFSEWLTPLNDSDLLSALVMEDANNDFLGQTIGVPDIDKAFWHQQIYPDSCAIVSQEYILESFTGNDFSETELVNEAIEKGYYYPGSGTTPSNVGMLLEEYDIDVERSHGNTVNDIIEKLENNQKIIVGIDADVIWDKSGEALLVDMFSLPDANHAVEIIGFDSETKMVILNDPGCPEGCGLEVPLSTFDRAWDDSNNFMMWTTESAPIENA